MEVRERLHAPAALFSEKKSQTHLPITRVNQKRDFPPKKHIYYNYTETKLISLFNVIPLDFSAPVPEFHKFFSNSVRKIDF